ncbi:hypothetical protein [Spirosoma rhododendri]|uniref:Uncharacterized protein n=1 Tax=Spirosoma rhododendri TaxID=2728024 RepID=A0A7L5DIW8_9BACT|nr:hypothetical protein [Spirosoma rhododendri]QJD78339.1 hypothetical protein HH216_07805 [Spirosoma rhododendri]
MKLSAYYRQISVCTILVSLLATCTRRQPDVPPADDGVRLLGVTIPGFPSENISIDQVKKEIVLTVPDSPSSLTFEKMSFQTSAGSSVWQEDHKRVDLCIGGAELVYVLSETKSNAYKFVVKQPRPLAIGFIDNQTKATIGQSLAVRIDNTTDGKGGGVVLLTRTDTGEQDSLRVGCQVDGNQYILETPQRVRPGEYIVALQKKSGRTATAPQKLTFQKGTPSVNELWGALTVGQSLTLAGSNLFADDAPEVLLRRSSGETTRIKPTSISPYGWSLTTALPATIQPGYYDIAVLFQGKTMSTKQRIVVLRDELQPAVGRINNELTTASETKPIVLVRGQHNFATIWPQLYSWGESRVKLDIKLTSIDNSGQSTRFLFSNQSYNGDYPPALNVPATVQSGRYILSVVATYTDGTVSESEPLERIVEVR